MKILSRFGIIVIVVLLSVIGLGALFLPSLFPAESVQPIPASTSNDDWPTFMYDGARSGFNKNETRLSPDNAANLKLLWKQRLGNVLAAQPIIKGDTVYEGSWDGNLYALNTKTGEMRWKVNLGQTSSKKCAPETAGITSAPAVTDNALYIGGGDDKLYALNPQTGATLWTFKTGDNSPEGGVYNWASPLFYKDRVYYGSSAFCDKPFPHGEMWSIDAATGKLDKQTNFIPEDQRGGGLWTSPTVDEATGAIYVTIGSGDYYIPYNYSIARLDSQTLSVQDAWQIPIDEQVFDGDWGTTPTLFRDGAGTLMVGAAAKNGYYYAFKASDIKSGPIWQARIADGGECPQCGEGAISTSAYAYDTVYVGAGYLSLGQAQKFAGTVHAFDPSTGATRWIHPTTGSVLPALTVANGLLVAVGDDTIEVLNAATGELLWEYATEAQIYAAPTIAGGVLYVATTGGYLYAFSAGPYDNQQTAYKVPPVGSNPPGFTPFRKPIDAAKLPGSEECFSETGKCTRGEFLLFWREKGGKERFGPAITNELNEAGRTVQYFQNAVLELHPKAEGQGTEVRIGKLDFRLFYYKPRDDNFDPVQPAPDATYVPETHHNLTEPFLLYWRTHGEVAGLGYPVSESFAEYNVLDGQTYQVQYFERSKLEITETVDGSEQVTLGALGLQRYKQRYGELPK